MSQVSPAEGIDLIQIQKTNWVIQKMIRFLEGSEILQHITIHIPASKFPDLATCINNQSQ